MAPVVGNPVTGLRFTIGTRDGRKGRVNYVRLKPRWLALACARALRRLAGPDGPLTVRTTVIAYSAVLPKFFAYLADTKEPFDTRNISVAVTLTASRVGWKQRANRASTWSPCLPSSLRSCAKSGPKEQWSCQPASAIGCVLRAPGRCRGRVRVMR